jgi:hypothetical protein
MDDITKVLGYAAIISVCGVIILRMVQAMIPPKPFPRPEPEPTPQPVIVPPAVFPSDILRSYRLAIDNSTTTMAYLVYLSSRLDAVEDELIAEVSRTITKTKPPRKDHVRHVLFALFASNFVSIKNSTRIYLTPLGRTAVESIARRDESPPATMNEIIGYRALISQNVLRMTILSVLREKHSLPKSALMEKVTEGYKHRNTSLPPMDSIELVAVSTTAFGWIAYTGNTWTITDMGKRVCDDLHL